MLVGEEIREALVWVALLLLVHLEGADRRVIVRSMLLFVMRGRVFRYLRTVRVYRDGR